MTPRRDEPSEEEMLASAPEDLQVFEEEDDGEDMGSAGRGLAFTAASLIVGFAIIAWGFVTLKSVIDRGYIEKLTNEFSDVSLMPERPEDGIKRSASEKALRVYYTHDGRTLEPHSVTLRHSAPPAERAQLILNQLFAPPRGGPLGSTLPAGTKLLGFFVNGATAYVNVSEDFLKPATPSAQGERLAVYGLVNSLTLSDLGVDAVQLLVGGQTIQSAWGWLDCSSPLGPNLSLIEK